jgi:hypothetical protein
VNIGTVGLSSVALNRTSLGQLTTALTCGGSGTQPIATLGPQGSVTCTGSIVFDQASFEQGPMQLSVVLTAGTADQQQQPLEAASNTLVVTPLRAAAVDVSHFCGQIPEAAGKLSSRQPDKGCVSNRKAALDSFAHQDHTIELVWCTTADAAVTGRRANS